MERWVEISFDCLPLRSVGRLDIPIDASPKYVERCRRVKAALEKHGSHNSYFLYNARCAFHLTNDVKVGTLTYRFEGVVLTDADDRRSDRVDLEVELESESCDWMTEPVVEWFGQSVREAVAVEFNRYVEAGDLEKTRQRIEKIQSESEQAGGYVGMYL